MKLLILGAVTAEKKQYKKKFAEAESRLFKQGHTVINPIEHCSEDVSWRQNIEICLGLLEKSEGVYVLPNYKQSRGTLLLLKRAQKLQLDIIFE